jgi:hypothetical protein
VADELVGEWRRPAWFHVRHLIESVGETWSNRWGTTGAVRFTCGMIAYANDLHPDEPNRGRCTKCRKEGNK